jgi:hypothetical protein
MVRHPHELVRARPIHHWRPWWLLDVLFPKAYALQTTMFAPGWGSYRARLARDNALVMTRSLCAPRLSKAGAARFQALVTARTLLVVQVLCVALPTISCHQVVHTPAESEFGVSIPNSLAAFERHSWALSVHTTTGGQAMDYPLKPIAANMTSHLVRFSGYYHAKQSGAPGTCGSKGSPLCWGCAQQRACFRWRGLLMRMPCCTQNDHRFAHAACAHSEQRI